MIYYNITPKWLAAIEARAQSELGMRIDGVAGQASKDGITIAWTYDADDQSLTVGDIKKPWFVMEEKVQEALTKLVNDTKPT